MLETGAINREVAAAIAKQGHGDMLMVTDAGFAIPLGVEVIDLSLDVNKPMVVEVLAMLKKYYSVEKIIIANETKEKNPTYFKSISKTFGEKVDVEIIGSSKIKEMSKTVKTVIRTGDFTAFGNVILVSGAGERWISER